MDILKPRFALLLILIFSIIFFSFRLSRVPSGITIDEAAFGYNAVLISKTLHDENNRFLPIFVLSINGKDWRQPTMQYFLVAVFKLFGASVYNLKFASVIVASISALLLFFIGKKLLGGLGGYLSLMFFISTPIVVIHSHLGLDNLMAIPFTLIWIISLLFFEKTKKTKYLIFSAVSLGIGFYSYKGMRSFVPIWSILTLLYLSLPFLQSRSIKAIKPLLKPVLYFSFASLPFFAVIPLLEYKYAGAVLGGVGFKIDSIYNFFYSYISSFDPSFLFIKGDEILHHSTGRHGMFLLASLPFFAAGIYQSLKSDKFWKLLVLAFFTGPLLFGFPGSIHRASRLISLVPIYAIIASLGVHYLWALMKNYKLIFFFLAALWAINSFDFLKYYWFSYGPDTYHIFYHAEGEKAYQTLFEESQKRTLTPYVTDEIIKQEKTDAGVPLAFFRSIYFPQAPDIWNEEKALPTQSILMTRNSNLQNLEKIKSESQDYFFYIH